MALPLFLSIYESIKDLKIKIIKQILFAPLVKLNKKTNILLSFSSMAPSFLNHIKISSNNTPEHRLKKYCTVGEYKAVFLLYKNYDIHKYSFFFNKSICIINKKDELMSSTKYHHYFDKLYYVKNSKRYHQLFIDKNYPLSELEQIFNVINEYVNFSLLSLTKLDYDKS